MFCKKCGNNIPEGAAFCPKCGEAVKNAAERTASGFPNQSIWPTSPVPAMSGTDMGKETQKKKAYIIAGAAAIVVLVLGIVNAARISNFMHKTFSSPKAYYQYIEKKTVKELSANAGEWYDSYILDALNFHDKSVEGELAVGLSEDGQEFLGLLGLAGVDLSWLREVSVSADAAVKNGIYALGTGFSLNDSNILSGNMVMEMEKGQIYFQIPELNKIYLGMDAYEGYYADPEEARLISEFSQNSKKLSDACPSQTQAEKLMNRYMLLALSCVDDVSKSADTLKVKDIEQKCTVLKVTIDADTMLDMAETVLEEMKDDKDIKAIMMDMLQAGGEIADEDVDADEAYERFQEAIEDTLDDLQYLTDMDMDEEIVMKVYVDDKGDIKGRTIDFGYMTIKSLMPEKGNKFGYELSITDAYREGVTLTGSGSRSGDTISGDFQVKYNGTSVVDITAKKFNTEDLKKGRINGGIEVKTASSLGSVAGYVPGLSIIEDIQISMDFKSTKNSSACKVGIIYGEQDLGSMSVSIKTGDGSKASIPSGNNVIMVEDMDDMEDWLEDVKLDQLTASLKKADAPSWVVDILEEVEDVDSLYEALDELMYYYYFY